MADKTTKENFINKINFFYKKKIQKFSKLFCPKETREGNFSGKKQSFFP